MSAGDGWSASDVGIAAAAVGCGVSAGVFFAFSSFVMEALRRLPPPDGMRAMRSVNRQAVTPVFMVVLFGTAALCAVLAIWALRSPSAPAARWVIAGAGIHLAGAIGVTIARNVPLNEALAKLDPTDATAGAAWRGYVGAWTRWNHLRAAASVAASVLLVAGLRAR